METPKKIPCPTCKNMSIWSTSNIFRPFCSERCKLIDLGEWANESYAIPQKFSEEDEIMSDMLGETGSN
jgi:uncharacterized protein